MNSSNRDLKLQGKLIVYAAIGGLLAMMGGFVFYASLDNPELEQAQISLSNVELLDVNTIENRIKLQTTFLVKNPSEKTFTVPIISYELYADGKRLATASYSTEDIAMPGRAAFYPGAEIPLTSIVQIPLSPDIAEEYQAIIEGEEVQYSVDGMLTVETAWSIVEIDFQSSM